MKTETDPPQLVTTSLGRLSKAIDRILSRFPSVDRPTKLTLLNDLAAAIRPGSNWGALKAALRPVAPVELQDAAAAVVTVPSAPPGARVLPARLCAIEAEPEQPSLGDLLEDARPLFDLTHLGLPIVGLELEAYEGNGDLDVSPWPNLLVLNDGQVEHCRPHALDMSDAVARLAFGAVQNLAVAPLYSVLGQLDTTSIHVILGRCGAAAAVPSTNGWGASREMPTQGVRVLLAKERPPAARDLEILLALAGAAMPHLGLHGFGPLESPVRLTLSAPREMAWRPVEATIPEALGEHDTFWRKGGRSWSPGAPDDFLCGKPHKLDEALDLALAVLDINDPDIFLHASVSPPPKMRPGSLPEAGWRGGLAAGWRILRMRPGAQSEVLDLGREDRHRLERALNGWAMREGFRLTESDKRSIEFVILRDRRRASHHLGEVRALAEAADA
jgi:hypothetical protein